ncbi:MAG: FecR domain-containing protein [Cyclobacteriaceae bacterium]|nr:FecR domain-containing protein [Cyclobacteriaceae bacterium]
MNHSPEEILDKLIKNRITREEFEALLAGLDSPETTEQYEIYLQQKFEEELDRHFNQEKPSPQLIVTKGSKKKKSPFSGNKNIYSIAAVIVIFAGVLFATLFFVSIIRMGSDSISISSSKAAPITKSTPNGRMFRMNFDDGSYVQMNAASSITYPNYFDAGKREISMEGEAYFNIARDEHRPFKIHVHDFDIEVLGTSFNVQSFPDDEDFAVTVESGTVRVQLNSKNHESVILEKGQKLVVNIKESLTEIVEVDPQLELSWRMGILRFDGTPLPKVARMLERWYGIEVELQDQSKLSKLTLTGLHKNENLKSVVQAITFATGTRYEIKDNSLIIKN